MCKTCAGKERKKEERGKRKKANSATISTKLNQEQSADFDDDHKADR